MAKLRMAHAWRTHGARMAHAWRTHGACMAHAWRTHGARMAHAWRTHGARMAPGPISLQIQWLFSIFSCFRLSSIFIFLVVFHFKTFVSSCHLWNSNSGLKSAYNFLIMFGIAKMVHFVKIIQLCLHILADVLQVEHANVCLIFIISMLNTVIPENFNWVN